MNCQERFLSCVNCNKIDNQTKELECQHVICMKCAKIQISTIENKIRDDKVLKCKYCKVSTILRKNEVDNFFEPKINKEPSPKTSSIQERIANLSQRINSVDRKPTSVKDNKIQINDNSRGCKVRKVAKDPHEFNAFQQYKDSLVTFTNLSTKDNNCGTLTNLHSGKKISIDRRNRVDKALKELSINAFEEKLNQKEQKTSKAHPCFVNLFKTTKIDSLKNSQSKNKVSDENKENIFKKSDKWQRKGTVAKTADNMNNVNLKEMIETHLKHNGKRRSGFKPKKEENSRIFEESLITVQSRVRDNPSLSPISRITRTPRSIIDENSFFKSELFGHSNLDVGRTIQKLESSINETTRQQVKDKQKIACLRNDMNKFFEKLILLLNKKQDEYNELFQDLLSINNTYYSNRYKEDSFFLKEYLYLNGDLEASERILEKNKEFRKKVQKLNELQLEKEADRSSEYSNLIDKMNVFESVNSKFKLFQQDCESFFECKLFKNAEVNNRLESKVMAARSVIEQSELMVLKSIQKSRRNSAFADNTDRKLRLSLDLKNERTGNPLKSLCLDAGTNTRKNHQLKLDIELKKLKMLLRG